MSLVPYSDSEDEEEEETQSEFSELLKLIGEGGWERDGAKLNQIGEEFLRNIEKNPPSELFPPKLLELLTGWLEDLFNANEEVLNGEGGGGNDGVESGDESLDEREGVSDGVQRGGASRAQTLPLTHFYELRGPRRTEVRRFDIYGKEYILRFKNQADMDDLEYVLLSVFSIVIERAFSEGHPDDLVGFQFHHDALDKGVFTCPFRPRRDLTAEKMMRLLQKILQSKKEIRLNQDLRITATRIQLPRGSGFRSERVIWNLENYLKDRHREGRSVLQIKNNDNLCFLRACVVGKAYIDKETNPEVAAKWTQIHRGDRHTIQKRLALELMENCGIASCENGCGFPEFEKVQAFLEPEYQLKIFNSKVGNAIVFMGKIPSKKIINLYLYNEHFSIITHIAAFANKSYWCNECNKGVGNILTHRCKSKCPRCFGVGKCQKGEEHYCRECNRKFYSKECYQRHLTSANFNNRDPKRRRRIDDDPACYRIQRCRDCGRTLNIANWKKFDADGKPLHQCGFYFCRRCNIWTKNGETHYCYIQPVDLEKEKKKSKRKLTQQEIQEREGDDEDDLDAIVRRREWEQEGRDVEEEERVERELPDAPITYVFWDFETFQEREIGENDYGPIYAHDPKCCIVTKVCSECKSRVQAQNFTEKCKACGENQRLFLGENCKEDFCKWLFSPENRGVTAIAHNAKGFDAQFLIQYLVKKAATLPEIIPRGLEIMAIIIRKWKIRVIDSFNFLPMALSALPNAFNIPELKKGFFPFKFFTSETWNYIGPWPDSWFYDPANMNEKKREEFFQWYHGQTNKIFNMQKELLEYCKSDVNVLMQCSLKFEDEYVQTTGVRPFQSAMTIASACNYVFRRNFLKPNTIGLIPHGGYRRREKQSAQALRWLKWVSETEDVDIQHARNGGEKRVGKYKLDGYSNINGTHKAYEFYGCVWHSCERCFPDERDTRRVPGSSLTYEDAYARTLKRAEYIRSRGIELVEMWECDLKKELEKNSEMREFFKLSKIKDPMDPKLAFYGGRTNSHYLIYEAKEGEKLRYVDVMSLYPFVNKWGKYPIGHPRIITEGFMQIYLGRQPYFGVIYCRVQPPRKLLIPVLPMRCDNKLMFPLCNRCMEERNQESCTHSKKERSLEGAWCSNELYKAVERGYEVEEIFEVWDYQESAQYDGKDAKTGLFTEYVNHFLKHKVEASGWPKTAATSEESKKEYIQKFEEREGVKLDAGNMKKNPGIRSQSKLCLNSFWGKFGQRSNMMKGEFFHDPVPFLKLVTDKTNIIHQVQPMGGEDAETVYVTYTKEEEFVDVLGNTNVVLAAFTTATARLKLYSYLEQLGARVVYMDTDSIVYKTSSGDTFELPTGSFLGDLTDELEEYGEGAYIDLFIGAGPKNYAYRVRKMDGTTEEVVKIRGFTLTHANANKLNLQSMRRKVEEFLRDRESEPTPIVGPKIERRKDREVVSLMKRKNYRIVYEKRRILSDGSTLPYGYCD